MGKFIVGLAVAVVITATQARAAGFQTPLPPTFGGETAKMSRLYQPLAACSKGEITCRDYCAKCNPISSCEVACVRMHNRCVGALCQERHKK